MQILLFGVDGSPAGVNLRIPILHDHTFFNYLLFVDWLASLSLPIGFIGAATNEYRQNETMLLYVFEGALSFHEFLPLRVTSFCTGELKDIDA